MDPYAGGAAMRSRMTRVFIVAAFSAACGTSPTVPDRTIGELRAAPTVVTIDGTTIELQADVWRDFQPISPPGGKGLRVSVRLPEAAAMFVIERIWVVSGAEV